MGCCHSSQTVQSNDNFIGNVDFDDITGSLEHRDEQAGGGLKNGKGDGKKLKNGAAGDGGQAEGIKKSYGGKLECCHFL